MPILEAAMWTPEDRVLVGDFGSGQALSDDQYRLIEPFIPPPKPGLDVWQWTCSHCGACHDRDVNAARNIRDKGLRLLAVGTTAAASRGTISRRKKLASRAHVPMKLKAPPGREESVHRGLRS